MTDVPIDQRPYVIYKGKQFIHAWDFAASESADPDTLQGVYNAAEIKLQAEEGDPIIWSITNGEIAVEDTQLVLTLPAARTTELPEGDYDMYMSLGTDAGSANELVMKGFVSIQEVN